MRLDVSDVQQQLSRAFDVAGGFQTDLSQSVSPVIQVGPLAPAPFGSDRYLCRGDSITGDATHTGVLAVVNPSTSQELLTIDEWWVESTAGQTWVLSFLQKNDGTLIETTIPPGLQWTDTDARFTLLNPFQQPGGLVSGLYIFEGSNVSLGGFANVTQTAILGSMLGPAGVWIKLPLPPIVLPPNLAIGAAPAANTQTWSQIVRGRRSPIRQK